MKHPASCHGQLLQHTPGKHRRTLPFPLVLLNPVTNKEVLTIEIHFNAAELLDKELTTMKSSFAPNTRTSRGQFGTEGTGSDAFSFLKSNNGNLELSFISS